MMGLLLLLLVGLLSAAAASPAPLRRFAFGSCAKSPQALAALLQRVPRPLDFWLWAGDAVYNDHRLGPGRFEAASAHEMQANYAARSAEPTYAALAASTRVLGIMDDHEGVNNMDGSEPRKEEFKQLFLDFLGEPATSERRQTGRGAYASYTWGTQPQEQAKLLLLDVRYDSDADDVLGAAQWMWLEREVASSQAAVHFVVSPIQVLGVDKLAFEKIAAHGDSYLRLARLLRGLRGVIFLSGDVHMSGCATRVGGTAVRTHSHRSFMQSTCGYSYRVTEFTSSGLTHTALDVTGPTVGAFLAGSFFRSQYSVGPLVLERSFGLVDVDWSARRVNMTIVGLSGPLHSLTVALDDLQPGHVLVNEHCMDPYRSLLYRLSGNDWAILVIGALVGSLAFGGALGCLVWCQCRQASRRKVE